MHQRNVANVPCRAWKWKKFAIGCGYLRLQRTQRRNEAEKFICECSCEKLIDFIFPHSSRLDACDLSPLCPLKQRGILSRAQQIHS